jgi:hypothetical protein
VTKIAMDAVSGHTSQGAQVRIETRGWGMAGVADADAVRVIVAKAPADVRPILPICAVIKIQKALIARRARMTAARPLRMNLRMTNAAILPMGGVRRRVHPGIAFIIVLGQRRQAESQRNLVGSLPPNEISFFPSRHSPPRIGSPGKLEATVQSGKHTPKLALPSDSSARDRSLFIQNDATQPPRRTLYRVRPIKGPHPDSRNQKKESQTRAGAHETWSFNSAWPTTRATFEWPRTAPVPQHRPKVRCPCRG